MTYIWEAIWGLTCRAGDRTTNPVSNNLPSLPLELKPPLISVPNSWLSASSMAASGASLLAVIPQMYGLLLKVLSLKEDLQQRLSHH